MKIGIIGLGIVGSACKFGFEKNGHTVLVHDIKITNSSIDNVLETEVVIICVPTPKLETGQCANSIVEEIIDNLNEKEYNGIITIKSTVSPGTTDCFIQKYNKLKICFVPEFLRERCAVTDFTENHDVCIIGTDDDEIFKKISKIHGKFPKKIMKLSTKEAEFCKYFNNSYNAMLVVFANSFYEICKKFNVDYANVKNAVVNRKHISDNYLECNNNFKGFGGMCLPKDLHAINYLCKDTGVEFFKNIIEENKKYLTTVYDGMRNE